MIKAHNFKISRISVIVVEKQGQSIPKVREYLISIYSTYINESELNLPTYDRYLIDSFLTVVSLPHYPSDVSVVHSEYTHDIHMLPYNFADIEYKSEMTLRHSGNPRAAAVIFLPSASS